PQPPQFELSLPIVSTQFPASQQFELHGALPQPPQLSGSLVMSTQVLLQHVFASPRHCPPHGAVSPGPVSLGGAESFGGLESFGTLVSGLGPESIGRVSSAAVPVAQPAYINAHKPMNAAGPTKRMSALASMNASSTELIARARVIST